MCFYTETAKSVLNRLLTVLFAVLTEWLECGRLLALAGAGGLGVSGWGAGEVSNASFVQNVNSNLHMQNILSG